jgi:hypothetical protein
MALYRLNKSYQKSLSVGLSSRLVWCILGDLSIDYEIHH